MRRSVQKIEGERCLLPSGRVFPKTWTVSTEVDLTRQPKNEGAPQWEQTPPLSALDPLSHGANIRVLPTKETHE